MITCQRHHDHHRAEPTGDALQTLLQEGISSHELPPIETWTRFRFSVKASWGLPSRRYPHPPGFSQDSLTSSQGCLSEGTMCEPPEGVGLHSTCAGKPLESFRQSLPRIFKSWLSLLRRQRQDAGRGRRSQEWKQEVQWEMNVR